MLNLHCVKCADLTEHVFSGSLEICIICLDPYLHSNEEIRQELERRMGNGRSMPEM